jgi:hypothetical protein
VREQTQKDLISVAIAARNKQKLIKVYKNELVQPYNEQAAIIAKDIDNARAMAEIIKKAIPLAEKVMASRLKLSGYDAMVAWLVGNVKDVSLGEKSVKQSLAKSEDQLVEKCKSAYKEPFGNHLATTSGYLRKEIKEVSLDELTVKQTLEPVDGDNNKYKFTVIEVNAKGSGAEHLYEFNLSDINPTSISVDVKGKWMYVVLETDFKGRIIKYYKDGKIQPYASGLQFAINDVEVSRNVASALIKAVKAVKPK